MHSNLRVVGGRQAKRATLRGARVWATLWERALSHLRGWCLSPGAGLVCCIGRQGGRISSDHLHAVIRLTGVRSRNNGKVEIAGT